MVEKIFHEARQRGGIAKHVTVHLMRHSFATLLLEHGMDVRNVQEPLGDRRPETTTIYTHVMQKDLRRIRSPLDNIVSGALPTTAPERSPTQGRT